MAAVLVLALAMPAGVLWLTIRAPGPDLTDLPVAFWVQLLVGFGAFLISAWVWVLRPADAATRLFALSGVATLVFTYAPAIYRGSEIALAPAVRTALLIANATGASAFGIAIGLLCLIYPTRLPAARWMGAAVLFGFGAWTLAALAGWLPVFASVHLITAVEMLVICLALAGQFANTRHDPAARAIAIWIGLAILFGAGGFILLTALPNVVAGAALLDSGYSFAFFLIIYLGIAAGLSRYKLFELGEWAYRVFFYVTGSVLLLALDLALAFVLPIGPGLAFALSVLVIAALYLPLRDGIARQLLPRPKLADDDVFQAVLDVSLEPAIERRERLWADLLARLFRPLDIAPVQTGPEHAAITDDGIEMNIPAIRDHAAYRLRYPWNGRGLFGAPHQRLATRLCDLLKHAEDSRNSYDRGVVEERMRIARDMHDNIGAQLLSALHSADGDRKDVMIRDSLSDLRAIVNDAAAPGRDFDEVFSDLRAETAERLESRGMQLDWRAELPAGFCPPPTLVHALRSIVREAVSNAIRHSGANRACVFFSISEAEFQVRISDNGAGFDPAQTGRRGGLDNMRLRVQGLGGRFDLKSSDEGSRILCGFPPASTGSTS